MIEKEMEESICCFPWYEPEFDQHLPSGVIKHAWLGNGP